MGTEVTVYLWHDDNEVGQDAVSAVFTEVARIDNLMSTYIEDSEMSAINREAAREKSIRHGHPSSLHLWWARRLADGVRGSQTA